MSLACEPTMEEVKQKHGPAVQVVFGKITALDAKAKSAPPVTQDGLKLDGKKVALEGEATNALFLHADDLAHPEVADPKGRSTVLASEVKGCGDVLGGTFPGVPGGAEIFMKRCAAAEYAFVLRTHEDQSPEVMADNKFVPGKYRGDVLLFRLSDGAALGGFSVAAENSHTVNVNSNEFDTTRLRNNLDASVFVAIQQKLQALAPGSVR
jgi:hypothetical protein